MKDTNNDNMTGEGCVLKRCPDSLPHADCVLVQVICRVFTEYGVFCFILSLPPHPLHPCKSRPGAILRTQYVYSFDYIARVLHGSYLKHLIIQIILAVHNNTHKSEIQ